MRNSNQKPEPLADVTAAEQKAAPKTEKTATAAKAEKAAATAKAKAEKAAAAAAAKAEKAAAAAAAKAEKAAAAAAAKAEKAPAVRKRAAAKKTEVKLYVQYQGKQISQEEAVEAVKAAWNGEAIQTLELYVKPEDGAIYYVVNGTESGKVAF
ncbi:MAG TPA: hypothetical protein H9839_03660 [Candidatus Intestinimonas stercorigallinarum]|nr:hypothetical protein [Candidatus Intestinimonas stercorigallinarum]